jgi:hypothetical protein
MALPWLPHPIFVPKRAVPAYKPPTPGVRGCCLLGGAPTLDPSALGPHLPNKGTVGLVYTCAFGFIDLGHLRDVADVTHYYYLWLTTGKKTKAGQKFLTAGLNVPFGILRTRGEFWEQHAPRTDDGVVELRRDIAPDEVIDVARSLAYAESIVHELDTYWVNHPNAPEEWDKLHGLHNSAFSPEDLPSNYLGSYVAAKALRSTSTSFEVAVTIELEALLGALDARPKAETDAALAEVHGDWFMPPLSRRFLRRRNFHWDTIKPSLVPNLPFCGSPPALPADLDLKPIPKADAFKAKYYPFFSILRWLPVQPWNVWAGDIGVAFESTRFATEVERSREDAVKTYGGEAEAP